MKNKIKVTAYPSETGLKRFEIDLLDIGYTKDVWENLSQSAKEKEIQQYLDDYPEQPYWSFQEIID